MLTLIAIVVTAVITTLINRKMRQHIITDLKKSHKDIIETAKVSWTAKGFDEGRAFAAKECKLMKIAMEFEELKKYNCSH